MSSAITKILFRQGTDLQRRTAGVTGVKFNVGEPAFCLDTHRLYVGTGTDVSGIVGGVPVGIKNHGSFANVFGAGTGGLNSTTYNTLTTNGVEVGDLLFDASTSITYYVSSKNVTTAAPSASDLGIFSINTESWQAWKGNTTTHVISTYGSSLYNVGIGCNSNIVGLTVKGSTTTTDTLSVFGNIIATGTITAGVPSDIKYKKNIEPLKNALDKVSKLNGVSFDWDCSFKTGHDVGIIAQEVEKILPEAIADRGDDGKFVDYYKIIPLLIEAIKELKETNTALEKTIEGLSR